MRVCGTLEIELSSARLLRHNDPRKQALAWLIKTRTIIGDDWITQRLDTGRRSNVSRAVNAFRSEALSKIKRLKRSLHVYTR
jgi:hypothetical protein